MDFASDIAYIGPIAQEEIFHDEIVDGLANSALEQAEVWAQESVEQKEAPKPGWINPEELKKEFLRLKELRKNIAASVRNVAVPTRGNAATGNLSTTQRQKVQQLANQAKTRLDTEAVARQKKLFNNK